MQNDNLKFKIILIVFLLSFCFLNLANAYDDKTTHPALTQEIVEFYNLSFPDKKLTDQQKEWIIEGSILEDTPPRWINHFYDPIYKVGWTGEKTGEVPASVVKIFSRFALSQEKPLSAVEWVKNYLIQEEYKLYGGNRTWKKALEYYADGNLEESYKTLGYVLHLLEDMSVPDHTRNDTHAQEVSGATGDKGSPYEQYTAKYNRQTIRDLDIVNSLKKENKSPITKSSIEDYLLSLAAYSNKYFFSKDTINDSKYQNPKIIREEGGFGYGLDENNREFPLVKVKIQLNNENKFQKIYLLEKDDFAYHAILSAYFSRLSPQAVLHGTGVINLFHKQAQEEIVRKEYPVRLVKFDFSKLILPVISLVGTGYKIINVSKSFFAQVGSVISNVFSSIGNFFLEITGTDQRFQPVGQVSLNTEESEREKEKSEINVINVINKQSQNIEPQKISEQKKSSERKSDLGWQTSANIGGAPKAANSSGYLVYSGGGGSSVSINRSAQQQSIKILINEVQTYPTGERFIELYNPNGSTVDLTGWYIQRKTQSGSIFGSLVSKTYFENKTINAYGYLLISRASLEGTDIILDNLILAESNTIQLKNSNGDAVDKVGWGNSSDCENNCAPEPLTTQSIQRKFQNNTFIDTDNNTHDFEIQTCPSPKVQSRACSPPQSNQAPSASFVYTPQNPQVGEIITFNAASSTDSDGNVISYQWNFGDNATSSTTTATTTHIYTQAGNYQISLIVFDNKNTSSTAFSLISILPDPRPTPVQDFVIQYSSSTMELIFNWQLSRDYSGNTSTIIYEIKEYSSAGTVIFRATSTTEFRKRINEIGRNYNFSIQAFDEGGLGSKITTSTIFVPGFFSGLYFYQDPRNNNDYLIEAYYSQYPFVPDLFGWPNAWKQIIFYLNGDFNKIVNIKYDICVGGDVVTGSLILPDSSDRCGSSGGAYSYALRYGKLEDNHFIIKAITPEEGFNNGDYLTVAFYSTQGTERMDGRVPYYGLVAVDKTKYYFQENFPISAHSAPTMPNNFRIIFNEQSDNPYFFASWATSTDPDSLDSEISYQLDYWLENNPSDKQRLITRQNSAQINVLISGNYIFELKASDEFNLYSEIAFGSSTAVIPVVLAEASSGNYNLVGLGGKNPLGPTQTQKIAQSFILAQKTKITSFKIHLANSVDYYDNPSGAKISLRPAEGGLPSEPEIVSFSLRPDEIPRYNTYLYGNGVKEFFFFPSSISVLEPGIYFLVIEPENYPIDVFWNLITLRSRDDSYLDGGSYAFYQTTNQWSGYYATDANFRIKGIIAE